MTTPDRVIVPLDVPTREQAIELLDLLPEVTFWKVGLELFVSTGADILGILNERGKKIFLDLKFHDIPNTVAGACRAASRYNVDLLTLHATAGRSALAAAKAAVSIAPSPPKLLAITVLTSLSARELAFDLKIPLELPEYALEMALLSQESGIDGAVCSPREVRELRRVCGDDFLLVCPGVRPDWAVKGDQSRTLTPSEAIAAGADYLVIGRPITGADNPREAWARICQELAAV
ncbi:orotidine-5'-phosphate decarboxylase [Pannus brasiliensis CCIBt3594]|uniref:Orotidine 5'-phosphate decarboxylase n=1 Tax=Pannus brasiliensis CCIBt3594 TaxID=1427578 RepID=A0AAW9QPI3_9CHRO